MRKILLCFLALSMPTAPSFAKGCIRGAVVGAVAGHFVGKGHAVAGAAAGCAIGHHEASKHADETNKSPEHAN